MHACKTSAPSFRKVAEFYHHRCVQFLIALDAGDELISRGVALTATCLLRSYEILDGDVDPNMHLRGAYSMASLHDVLSGIPQAGLLGAGFWNYLREDITFSLFEECPLKMDLETTPLTIQHSSDQDYLNSITLILGKIINMSFKQNTDGRQWDCIKEDLKSWRNSCPRHMKPYSRLQGESATSHLFPAIWFLQPCHGEPSPSCHETAMSLMPNSCDTSLLPRRNDNSLHLHFSKKPRRPRRSSSAWTRSSVQRNVS